MVSPIPLRTGATLVIVAGLSAMLLGIATAFLVRLRTDGEEVRVVVRETQARIMLYAACNFIQESARLGYDADGFGYLDPRGQMTDPTTPLVPADDIGPRDVLGRRLFSADASHWPIEGSVIRCPMYVMERPPWAVQSTYAYNPVTVDPATGDRTDPVTGSSLGETGDWRRFARFTVPDPLPALPPDLAYPKYLTDAAVMVKAKESFRDGDPRPRAKSLGLSWFRVYRETDADRNGDGNPYYDTIHVEGMPTFIITCGAGPTQGFIDWNDVVANGQTGQFGDQNGFLEMRARENILWFRVEWSASVNAGMVNMFRRDSIFQGLARKGRNERWQFSVPNIQRPPFVFPNRPTSTSESFGNWNGSAVDTGILKPHAYNYARKSQLNFCGTIRWIQRLDRMPPKW